MKIIFVSIAVIFVAIIYLFNSGSEDGDIYLIPKNYRGTVVIFFNIKDGKEPQYNKKNRVYEIENDGILRTQFSERTSSVNLKNVHYYLYDEKTKTKKEIKYNEDIPFHMEKVYSPDTMLFVFAKRYESGLTNKNYEEYRYMHFIIGNIKQADSLFKARESTHLPDLIYK